MIPGRTYNLSPPANIEGRLFDRVVCEHNNPACPGEFVVRGIPRRGGRMESFVLILNNKGSVGINESTILTRE